MATHHPVGLRIIAIVKILSATLLACVGLGIFHLLRSDIAFTLEHFVHRLHLDPENHYVISAMAGISGITAKHLKELDAGTFFYALLYLVEGIGLLRGRHWAEYLTVIATGLFIPLELYEVVHKTNTLRTGVLTANIIILFYLILQLRRNRQAVRPRR